MLLSNNALALVAFFIATGLLVDRYSDSGYWIAFIISLPVYIFVVRTRPEIPVQPLPLPDAAVLCASC